MMLSSALASRAAGRVDCGARPASAAGKPFAAFSGRGARLSVTASATGPESGVSVSTTTNSAEQAPLTPTVRARKAVTKAPKPAPVQHSTSYVLKDRQDFTEVAEASSSVESEASSTKDTGNALADALRKADAHLNNMERSSAKGESSNILWDAAESELGRSTVQGLNQAAELTVAGSKWAATEGLKAAKPAGKWLVGQLGNAVGEIAKAAAKRGESKKNNK